MKPRGREPGRERERPALSWKKKLLFSLAAMVVFFVVLELVLALLGVRPILHDEDPYVGFSSHVPLFVKTELSDGKPYMVSARNKLDWFNMQHFAVEKTPQTYRLFCVGGSTTYGRPYSDATSFCGWLRELLAVADPSRNWEVINAGGISYASYRVAKLMEELTEYEPDLFIVYSGHNEFLERRTYGDVAEQSKAVRTIDRFLSETRTFSALKRLIRDRTPGPVTASDGRYELESEVKTLLDGAGGPELYHRDDAFTEKLLAHYRLNLHRMIDIARSAGARVVLVSPASNLRHCAPFKSEHRSDLTHEDLERWQALFAEAERLEARGRIDEALAKLREAKRLDDRYAQLHYREGQLLFARGRYAEAKAAFLRARDEDVCPLRAPSAIRAIIAEVAREREVPLVDFAAAVDAGAEGGSPGANVFLDHVHPTVEGHRRLALLLIEELEAQEILRLHGTWGPEVIERVVKRVEGKLDRSAHGMALRNLAKVLGWAGKVEEADRLARRAADMVPDDANAQYLAGMAYERLGDLARAKAYYQHAIRLRPEYADAHNILGGVLEKQGDLDGALEHYREAVRIRPDFAEAHHNVGGLLASRGDTEEAQEHFEDAMRINPEFAENHNDLGTLLAKKGEFARAKARFEAALRINPDFAEACHNLGLIHAQNGELREAQTLIERALRIRPDYVRARETLLHVRSLLQRNAIHAREELPQK